MAAAATEVNDLRLSMTLHSALEDFDTWIPTRAAVPVGSPRWLTDADLVAPGWCCLDLESRRHRIFVRSAHWTACSRQDGEMSLNPPTQYSTDDNLRARQRLWEAQVPRFDLIGWVLDVAGFDPEADRRVLDVGCGNGNYLAELRRRGVLAVGCDMSFGMLGAALPHPALVQADVSALPLDAASFDLVLAPHMLYHVDDREQATAELHRVTAPGGRCVVVTNGTGHMRSLRSMLETAVRRATSDWEMRAAPRRMCSRPTTEPTSRAPRSMTSR